MLEKRIVQAVLAKYFQEDFANQYKAHIYKKLAKEFNLAYGQIRAICSGYSYRSTYSEIVDNRVEELVVLLKEFIRTKDEFNVEEWNKFSSYDSEKAKTILGYELKTLFNIIKARRKQQNEK